MSLSEQRIAEVEDLLDQQIAACKLLLMSPLAVDGMTSEQIGAQIMALREMVDSRQKALDNPISPNVPEQLHTKVREADRIVVEAATRELDWLLELPITTPNKENK